MRGQYGSGYVAGEEVLDYHQEPNVPADSNTPTYIAAKLEIDNWRWAGTPFYIRTGKRLAKRVTEVAVQFKRPPHLPFSREAAEHLEANSLVLRIQPDEGISLRFGAKAPTPTLSIRTVNMDFLYGSSFLADVPEAYETLLLDAIRGDGTLFTRQDSVERSWEICDPLIEQWRTGPAAGLRVGLLGAGRRRRAAGPRRAALEAAVSRHQSGWIEVGEVERALAALRAGEGHPSVRATTLNLVVRCGDAEQLKIAHRVLDRIGSSRPLRAMIVMPATGTPRARVSSDSGSDHRREVFNELVELRGNRVALPSSVTSLLVADLPVFLWWQGELPPEGDAVLEEMVEMTTRMIVDSDQAGIDAVARVDAMATGLVDLAWVRTGPWREAIAALFDGRSQRRLLDHLVAVEVSGPRNQSALLAGWLRSRLGREVGLETRRAARVNRVRLICGNESFLVERSGRNEHGTASGPGLAPRTVALPSSAVALLLAGELDRLGAERPFEDALAEAQAA